ncbi:MAG: tetratricopeptide repeat protein [Candidatus Sabulitectum sp.]|nr:tetratricopeptide repeat protein [Candidatus Sabulitectum sp.]
MPNIENDIQDLYQSWLSLPTPALCVRLAGQLRHSGRNIEALEVARKGLARWQENISVNVVFGRCALEEKMNDEALEVFERVISIDPLNLIAIRSLAEIHYENSNWNRSIELFEEYLFEYPGDPEIEEILKSAREKKKEAVREARITGQDVTYPETGRMASILAAQKNTDKNPVENSLQSNSQNSTDVSEHQARAPRSLFNLFSSEECEDLGLSAYDK